MGRKEKGKGYRTVFVVDDLAVSGSPPVGRGRTWKEALGDYLYNNMHNFGIKLEIHESAKATWERFRKRELKKR